MSVQVHALDEMKLYKNRVTSKYKEVSVSIPTSPSTISTSTIPQHILSDGDLKKPLKISCEDSCSIVEGINE